ncbi:DUF6438 domain-containing protein [Chloroflexota bacterium]
MKVNRIWISILLVMALSFGFTACANHTPVSITEPAKSPNPTQQSTPTSAELKDVIITLERTACKGTCPVYKLTIYGSGTVVYEGKDYVKTTGNKESGISVDKIEQILSEFKNIDYFSLHDSYVQRVITDAPSVITSIKVGGETKTIIHYHGDLNAPDALEALEDKIDEIVNSDQWIK